MGAQGVRKPYYVPTTEIDMAVPYVAIGGTVFGPFDGEVRRSFVRAFGVEDTASSIYKRSETRALVANQRLAESLAARLNQQPDICIVNPPMALAAVIIRQIATDVLTECGGGQFQLTPLLFRHVTQSFHINPR